MFVDVLRKVKEVQFFALMALLVAAEYILILAGGLPPMMEDHIGHQAFFVLRMMVFFAFAWTLAGKPLVQTLVKGGTIALTGVVTQVVFIFIGNAVGRVVLGIAVQSDTVLYIVLTISAAINILFGAVIISFAAWFFSKMRPKATISSKIKKRKR